MDQLATYYETLDKHENHQRSPICFPNRFNSDLNAHTLPKCTCVSVLSTAGRVIAPKFLKVRILQVTVRQGHSPSGRGVI